MNTKEKLMEKQLYYIVRRIFDDGLRSFTIGERIETPEYYVEKLKALLTSEVESKDIEIEQLHEANKGLSDLLSEMLKDDYWGKKKQIYSKALSYIGGGK